MILPSYLTYLNFGVNIAMILAHICCIIPMSYLIYCSRFNRRVLKAKSLSTTLYTFIIVHAIGAAAVLPYPVYLLVKWEHGMTVVNKVTLTVTVIVTVGIIDNNPHLTIANVVNDSYDPYILLLLGMWEPMYFGLSSALAFILTLNRCMGLRFPLRYNRIKKVFAALSVVCLVILGFVFLCGSLAEVPLDKTSNCQTYNCVANKYHNTAFIKLTFAVFNTILMCYFLYALKSTGNDRVNDNLVKITMILEVALTTIPLLAARLFAFVTGLNSANYIGETNILMYALNSAICAIYYYKILLKSSSEIVLLTSRTFATL